MLLIDQHVKHYNYKSMPAFFVGVAMLLGCSCALHWSVLIVAIAFLVMCQKRLVLLCVMILMCGYSLWRAPGTPPTCQEGTFRPISAKPTQLPFKSVLIVEGTFEGYPCSMCLARNAKPPLDGAYRIAGHLQGKYFKPAKKAKWEKIPGTFSFAGYRFGIKQAVQAYVKRHYWPKETADFITAISSGELENRMVRFFFARLGLQHILAISGFHFALIALLVGWVMSKLLPIKWASALLLFMLAAYAFLLGDTPSVMRSFLMIALYLVGILIDRKTDPLNTLGVALMVELFYDPSHAAHLGFLLSYSATLSIFLFYKQCESWMNYLLPARSKEELEHFPRLDAYGYLAGSYIRRALGLNLSVHLAILPILFACFGTFPVLSLGYNLFIPLLVTGIIALFLVGLVLPPVHALNSCYTTWVLELIRYPPQPWMFTLRLNGFPPWAAILLVGTLFLWGLHKKLAIPK